MNLRTLSVFFILVCSINQAHGKHTFIFSHGFGGHAGQVNYYNKSKIKFGIVPNDCITFNYPEVVFKKIEEGKFKVTVDASKSTFAQKDDIAALKKACDGVQGDKVLVGVSRGAATILNYTSRYPENIKALVVEAPFDSIDTVLDNKLGKFNWIPGSMKLARTVFNNLYKSYKFNGPKPIREIRRLRKNIPVLLIHSKEDSLIPLVAAKRLYKRLKNSGHKDVYLLIFDKGQHANYQSGPDAAKYEATVHAFYAKYGIAHDGALAHQGKKHLELAQLQK